MIYSCILYCVPFILIPLLTYLGSSKGNTVRSSSYYEIKFRIPWTHMVNSVPITVVICWLLTYILVDKEHMCVCNGEAMEFNHNFWTWSLWARKSRDMSHFDNQILDEETQFQGSKGNCFRSPSQWLIVSRKSKWLLKW